MTPLEVLLACWCVAVVIGAIALLILRGGAIEQAAVDAEDAERIARINAELRARPVTEPEPGEPMANRIDLFI